MAYILVHCTVEIQTVLTNTYNKSCPLYSEENGEDDLITELKTMLLSQTAGLKFYFVDYYI